MILRTITHKDTEEWSRNMFVYWDVFISTQQKQYEEVALETRTAAVSVGKCLFQCFANDTVYHISVNESDWSGKHDPSWIWLANLTLFQYILWHNAPVITFDQLDISSVYEKWISTEALQANFGKCMLHSHSAFSSPITQFSLHLHIKPISQSILFLKTLHRTTNVNTHNTDKVDKGISLTLWNLWEKSFKEIFEIDMSLVFFV